MEWTCWETRNRCRAEPGLMTSQEMELFSLDKEELGGGECFDAVHESMAVGAIP